MKLVRLILVMASWLALGAGLVLTGKVSLAGSKAETKGPVAQGQTIPFDQGEAKIELRRAGALKLSLALVVRGDRDATRVYKAWQVARPEIDGQVQVTIQTDGPLSFDWKTPLSQVSVSNESIYKEEASYFLLESTEFASPGPGEARVELRATSEAARSSLSRLYLLVGDISEDFELFVAKNATPGLILLAGMAGVFSHLFMILGRLVIPMSSIALPEEEF